MTPDESAALDTARAMAVARVPVFIAPPDSSSTTGFALPRNWQHTVPDPSVVDRWQPGMAIAAVMGHGLDVVDVDPRNGGDMAALNGRTPVSYGIALTPSGGIHSFIRSLGIAKKTNVLPGIDLQAGAPDGSGRGFVFIAPTVRTSKATGQPARYAWAQPLDLGRWRRDGPNDQSGAALIELARAGRAPNVTPEQFMRARSAGAPTIAELVANGIPDGDAQDEALRDLAWKLRADNVSRDVAHGLWFTVVEHTTLTRLDQPWTDADFDRHWSGADRKLSADAVNWAALGVDTASLAAGQTPMPATVEVGPSPARYFTDKGVLLAATLAEDVIRIGPLRQGADHQLWSYQRGVWHEDPDAVRNRVARLMGERFRTTQVTTAGAIVLSRVATITCDPVPEFINFTNGLLDWRTGQLHQHSPDVATTVQLGVAYDPTSECPAFDKFIAEVIVPDAVPVVWELIAYLMYSGNPLHRAVMFTGIGRNGKGVLLHVIEALLGAGNVTAVSLYDLVATRFSTASLFGKLANIAGDIDAKYLESTAMLKAITGGDSISAEHKGRPRFDYRPWAVPVFSANKIPASADVSLGYLSRWLVVNFPHSFHGRENRTLERTLTSPAELAGIAARAVSVLAALLERGNFTDSAATLEAAADFARRVDQVRSWAFECAELDPALPFVARKDLDDAYARWAGRESQQRVKAHEFYSRLEGLGAIPTKQVGVRGFTGIRVVDQAHLTWPTGGFSGAGATESGAGPKSPNPTNDVNTAAPGAGTDRLAAPGSSPAKPGGPAVQMSDLGQVGQVKPPSPEQRVRGIEKGIGKKLPQVPQPAPALAGAPPAVGWCPGKPCRRLGHGLCSAGCLDGLAAE